MTAASDAMPVAAPAGAKPVAASASRRPGSVLLVSINRDEGDTGVHTHAKMLSAGLRDAGVRCEHVGPFGGSGKWLPVFAIRPLLLRHINKSWATLWHRKFHAAALRENLRRQLGEEPVDVIVAQCPVSASAAMEVRSESRISTPIVMVCHFNGSEAQEYRDKGELTDDAFERMLEFEKQVLESVDRVIYVSNWARQNVEHDRRLRTRSSAVVWNGASPVPQANLSRDELGLSRDDLVLINVGTIEPRKNQIALIDLFEQIHRRFPKCRLLLVGDGPQRSPVREKVERLGLTDAVKLLGHRRDVSALLAVADAYLHYATLENCPLALLEAARAGIPIAAVPTGGVPELQDALDCRIDLDPADVTGTIDRLLPILSDENARKDLGRRARAAFERTFTQEAMTKAYLEALSF